MATYQPTSDDLNGNRTYLRFLVRSQLDGRLQQRVDASDIVQETLLEAHRSLEQFHGESEADLTAWLRRIVARRLAHAFRDHTRQRRDVRRERSLEASLDASSCRLEQLVAGNSDSPSQQAISAERLRELADALESLTPMQREAIILHYFQGRTLPQIAIELQRSEAAIGGLLHRGMQARKTQFRKSSE